jgi:hypothetical protein
MRKEVGDFREGGCLGKSRCGWIDPMQISVRI